MSLIKKSKNVLRAVSYIIINPFSLNIIGILWSIVRAEKPGRLRTVFGIIFKMLGCLIVVSSCNGLLTQLIWQAVKELCCICRDTKADLVTTPQLVRGHLAWSLPSVHRSYLYGKYSMSRLQWRNTYFGKIQRGLRRPYSSRQSFVIYFFTCNIY